MNWRQRMALATAFGVALACMAADSSWKRNVPEAYRTRVNPDASRQDAIAAGRKLFAADCSQCHGSDALGKKGRPSLRSREVQEATDGELFWLLRNGDRRHGMPSWSFLPEPSRWQIVAYVKSLGLATTRESADKEAERKQ